MNKILKKVKPSKIEYYIIHKVINNFLNKLKTEQTIPVLGGSTAKGTWLKGDHDIDIFVKFKTEQNISERLEKLLKENFSKVLRVHGSRDYFQIKRLFLKFEVVPILEINTTKEAKNITDCSPLHVEWIRNHLNDKQKDEVRILKKFCKAQRVYGAETHIKGFSGYTLELLIAYYKSFEKTLRASTKWKKGTVIKFNKKIPKLNESKISYLIIIDPTEENRNAAAALSKEKINKFIESAKGYLKNPSAKFFKIKEIEIKNLKEKDIVLEVWPKEGKKDIVAAKIIKCYEFLTKELENHSFKIVNSDIYFKDKKPALIYYDLKHQIIPKEYKHYGPPLKKKEDIKKFQEKHKNIHKEGKKVYTILERKHTHVKDLINDLIQEAYIKEKVKNIKLL